MIFRVKTLAAAAWWCVVWSSAAPALSAQPAPHAVHDGRFGGNFAATASDTLHVEAIWSQQRRLRVFVMDATGNLLPIERLREVVATAIAGDRESPLTLLEAEFYFEARIPTLPLPAVIVVRVKPSPAAAEERLSFSFTDYSPELVGIGSTPPVEIPGTLAGILTALEDERRSARTAVNASEFSALLGAEDRIRDLVLAIEPYLERLPAAERLKAQSAITAVVRACWLLHTVFDYGAAGQRDAVFRQLDEALDRTVAAVSGMAR
jgi:hypothetical protein